MKHTPLPNWLVVGNSAIIIGISAALAGLALSGILSWNIVAFYLGWMLLPFPLTVGCLQYMAGVRHNAWAAAMVARIHCFACALLCLPCFIAFIAFFVSIPSGKAYEVLCIAWPFLAMCMYCGFCCWTNRRLTERLCTTTEEGGSQATTGAKHFQFTLRELLGVIAITSIVASVASYMIRLEGKQFAEHIAREASPVNLFQLPEGAADVCYCLSGRGLLSYEFTIDEAGFLDWAEKQFDSSPSNAANAIDKIQKGGPFTIERYTDRMPEPSSNENNMASITQGYFHEWSKGDEGFKLAYDSAKQRAYFYRY